MTTFLSQYADHIGIIGVLLTLIAYAALSVGKMAAEALSYSLLNFFGSWLIVISLLFHWNLSSFVIEAAWIFISMIGIYRFYAGRNKKRPTSNLYVISNDKHPNNSLK